MEIHKSKWKDVWKMEDQFKSSVFLQARNGLSIDIRLNENSFTIFVAEFLQHFGQIDGTSERNTWIHIRKLLGRAIKHAPTPFHIIVSSKTLVGNTQHID